jgi:hypothetical protein
MKITNYIYVHMIAAILLHIQDLTSNQTREDTCVVDKLDTHFCVITSTLKVVNYELFERCYWMFSDIISSRYSYFFSFFCCFAL